MRRIAALAVLVASAAFADDAADPPKELDPLTVHPSTDDPLFESDRKLRLLIDSMPCMGCDAEKKRPDGWKQIAKDIGKAMLNQVTPINPEVRTSDPGVESPDLSPDAVSPAKPAGEGGRMDPALDGNVEPKSNLP